MKQKTERDSTNVWVHGGYSQLRDISKKHSEFRWERWAAGHLSTIPCTRHKWYLHVTTTAQLARYSKLNKIVFSHCIVSSSRKVEVSVYGTVSHWDHCDGKGRHMPVVDPHHLELHPTDVK